MTSSTCDDVIGLNLGYTVGADLLPKARCLVDRTDALLRVVELAEGGSRKPGGTRGDPNYNANQ